MLRPNKNVERKLILASLQKLRQNMPIADYRYVGFGSMWFADFILMHKHLGINDLVTIESQKTRAKRVEFNKPFACISVRMEEAATALGDVLDEKQSIVWLDYDGPLRNAMSGDIETAIGAMSPGSMLLVTVNAKVDQLKGNKKEEVEISPEDYLADICENKNLKEQKNRLTKNEFPIVASEILHSRMKAAVLEKKPDCEFLPIWSYRYADDATMITVGGMVATDAHQQKLNKSGIFDLHFITRSDLFDIELPVLTEKEKRALDKRLPSTKPLSLASIEFELRPTELAAYQKFYLEYPIFNEVTP